MMNYEHMESFVEETQPEAPAECKPTDLSRAGIQRTPCGSTGVHSKSCTVARKGEQGQRWYFRFIPFQYGAPFGYPEQC